VDRSTSLCNLLININHDKNDEYLKILKLRETPYLRLACRC